MKDGLKTTRTRKFYISAIIYLLLFTLVFTAAANAAAKSYTITYNANGGHFQNGETVNKVTKTTPTTTVTKYAHSNNINDSGVRSGGMGTNQRLKKVVTIEGAEKLSVSIRYSTYGYGSSYGTVYIIPGNYSGSISAYNGNYGQTARLSGYTSGSSYRTANYTITGNTVTFGLYTGSSSYNTYSTSVYSYGFYAVVTGEVPGQEQTTGTYEEPVHYDSDYTFASWNMQANGNGATFTDNKTSKTVYAKWNGPKAKGTIGGVTWKVEQNNDLLIYPTDGVSGTLPDGLTSKADWPWNAYNAQIKNITVSDGVIAGDSLAHMFDGVYSVGNVDLRGLDTSNTENMSYMFANCTTLCKNGNTLNLTGLDTSNVTDMSYMFFGCSTAGQMDLSALDTSSVETMEGMFKLTSARGANPIHTGWDLSNVKNMSSMFEETTVQTYDLSLWDLSNVENVSKMFANCEYLESVSLNGADTSNVTNAEGMFQNCTALTSIDLSPLNLENAANLSHLFDGDTSLTSIELGTSAFAGAENTSGMFASTRVTSLDVSNMNTANVTDASGMFADMSKLEEITLGQNFEFHNAVLPGSKWTNVSTGDEYTVNDLRDTYDGSTMAGTYSNVSAHAILYENGELVLQNNGTPDPSKGAVVETWAGIETATSQPWANRASEIKKVTVQDELHPISLNSWFANCSNCTEMDLTNLKTDKVTDMSQVFLYCSKMTEFDVSGFDTSNVEKMNAAFLGCTSLTSLDLSTFNTEKVTSMSSMVGGCTSLQNLDISNWDLRSVESTNAFGSFFGGATALKTVSAANWTNIPESFQHLFGRTAGLQAVLDNLDVSGWDLTGVKGISGLFGDMKTKEITGIDSWANTASLTDVNNMFAGCVNLTGVDVSGLNTENVENMSTMFSGCSSLQSVDLSTFDTKKLTNAQAIFSGCSSLQTVDLSNWDFSSATNTGVLGNAFGGASNLKNIIAKNWNHLPETFSNGFSRTMSCSANLDNIDVTGWDLTGVKDITGLFADSRTKQITGINTWTNTGSLENLSQLFYSCYNLQAVDISGLQTSHVTSMYQMFNSCSALETITGLNTLNTESCTDMSYMFAYCSRLREVDVSNFDTANVVNMYDMFYYCSALTSLDVSGFNTAKVTNMSYIFGSCTNLQNLNASNFDFSGYAGTTNYPTNMFSGSNALVNVTLKNWSHLPTNTYFTLYNEGLNNASNLSVLDVEGWDVAGRQSMENMFRELKMYTINGLNTWTHTEDIRNMYYMFYYCQRLTSLDLSGFDTSNVTNFGYMCYGDIALQMLNLSNFDFSSGTSFYGIVGYAPELQAAILKNWHNMPQNNTSFNLYSMNFNYSQKLSYVDVEGWDLDGMQTVSKMFQYMKMKQLNGLDTWTNMSSIRDFSYMFYVCNNLTELDTSAFDTSSATNMYSIFGSMDALQTLDISSLDTTKVTNSSSMFNNDSALSTVVLGEDFKFKDSQLPGAKWQNTTTGECFTTTYLKANYDGETMAATYVNKTGTAILYESGELVFQNSSTPDPEKGNVVASWTNFETRNYTNRTAVPWSSYASRVTKVTVQDEIMPIDTRYWFYGMYNCTEMDLANLNTKYVTYMDSMFSGCSALTNLDLSTFDTTSLISAGGMASGCNNLEHLNMDGWVLLHAGSSNNDGSGTLTAVTGGMWSGCNKLKDVSMKNWVLPANINDATGRAGVLQSADLEWIDVTGWDTTRTTNMSGLFGLCSAREIRGLDTLNTSNVTNMAYLFNQANRIESIDISSFDTSKVTNFAVMFSACDSLKTADISGWDFSGLTNPGNMGGMFSSTPALETVTAKNWSNMPETFSHIFGRIMSADENNSPNLQSIDVTGWDLTGVKNIEGLFAETTSRAITGLDTWDTSGITNMNSMFMGTKNLVNFDTSRFNTANVESMISMFSGAESVSFLNLTNFNTEKVKNFAEMFKDMKSLSELNISSFNVDGVTESMTDMFLNDEAMRKITLGSDFDFDPLGDEEKAAILPEASLKTTTGKWMKEDETVGPTTVEDIRDNYGNNQNSWAGTWVWENPVKYQIVFEQSEHQEGEPMESPIYVVAAEDAALAKAPKGTLGYAFSHWVVKDTDLEVTYEDEGTIPGNTYAIGDTVTLVPVYEQVKVPYFVLHFKEKEEMDGSYELFQVDEEEADAYQIVQPPLSDNIVGYKPPEIQTVTINRENMAINYYYDRTQFYVAFHGNGADMEDYRKHAGDFLWYDTEGDYIRTYQNGDYVPETMIPAVYMIGDKNYVLPGNEYRDKNGPFFGWNTLPDGTGTNYADKATVRSITDSGTLVLYAKWSVQPETQTNDFGELVVRAKPGERVVIPGLPAGTNYHIDETNLPPGWKLIGILQEIDGKDQTIEPNDTKTALVTNEYHAEGSARIIAHKRLTGDTLQAGMFNFRLLDSEGNAIDAKSNGAPDKEENIYNTEGEALPNPWYNTGNVIFNEIVYDKEGTYTYKIVEIAGNDETIEYDEHEETVVVTVTDAGNGTMDTSVTYEGNGALFVNNKKPAAPLRVSKTIANATQAAQNTVFNFTVLLKDVSENSIEGEFPVAIYDTANMEEVLEETTVRDGGTVSIAGGQTFVVSGLPHGTRYMVEEQESNGWELTEKSGESGTIGLEEQSALFRNTYSTVGSAELRGTKNFIGGTIASNQFGFELRNASGEVLDTAYVDEEGNVVFKPIDYTEEDDGKTFLYTVQELNFGDTDIIYDGSVKNVTVEVHDSGEGTLLTNVEYDGDAMVFTNNQKAALTVEKQVNGNMGSRDKSFLFELHLMNEDDTPYTGTVEFANEPKFWENTEDGVYAFMLAHGESITVIVPSTTKYRIEEHPEDYTTRITTKVGEKVVKNNDRDIIAEGSVNAANGNTHILYKNTRLGIVPTGLQDYGAAGIALIIAAAMGFLVFMKNHRRKEK